jgi:hypothetical protein
MAAARNWAGKKGAENTFGDVSKEMEAADQVLDWVTGCRLAHCGNVRAILLSGGNGGEVQW